ncbi:MAG: cysteine hydrolase family protein [Acetobacteraceae bacterium]
MIIDPARLALVLIDLQNDFLDAAGAFARGGVNVAALAGLPARLAPLLAAVRRAGGLVVSTHFTLVPGRGGEPIVAPRLKAIRPFLRRGDFASGSRGHALVDGLAPADISIEKVGDSGFYMSPLEWVLRHTGIDTLAIGGIATNGAVASTLRDAELREFRSLVLADCCAAFDAEQHATALAALRAVAEITNAATLTATLARWG